MPPTGRRRRAGVRVARPPPPGTTPAIRSAWTSMRPMGPQPTTAAELPRCTWPRSRQWRATPSGSSMATVASSKSVRHRVQEPRRPGDVLPQASVGGAVTGEADLWAQVGVAFPAPVARVVGDSRVDGDAPAIEGAAFYRPPEFVAQDERPTEQCITDAPLAEPMEVGTAQADRSHPYQALAGPGSGRGSSTTSIVPGPLNLAAFIEVPPYLAMAFQFPGRNRRPDRACARNGAR